MSKLEESAFGLSQDELQQIRYLETLKRRKKRDSGKRFSDGLSVEAQIAMQQALEDTQTTDCPAAPSSEVHRNSSAGRPPSGGGLLRRKVGRTVTPTQENEGEKTVSFAVLFEQKASRRMSDDITMGGRSSESGSRQALGGGKLPNAMEIIEFVNHDEPAAEVDDAAIEELARINSMEKCQVWMEATDHRTHMESPVFKDNDSTLYEQREMES